ncbi:hypothetical protein HHI36_009991 [Cryptolaemus montrouzieri]|uniref:Uncharacterized protein n=1 Tax=Cryptolaemus montrouzieri TaxID=559131 RepID=A0ABD2MHH8_9CUCU
MELLCGCFLLQFHDILIFQKRIEQLLKLETIKHCIYPNYLLQVLGKYPEYMNTLTLINRFEAIQNSLKYTYEKYEKSLLLLENFRSEMNKVTTENVITMDWLLMKLNQLLQTYTKSYQRSINNERIILTIAVYVNTKMSEFVHCINHIDSLYNFLCERGNIVPIFSLGDYKINYLSLKQL